MNSNCPAPSPGTVRTYLPIGLDLSTCLPAKWVDYGRFVAGGLYLRRHLEKYRDPDGYLPVSSEALRRVLPKRDYLAILDGLRSGRVVESTPGYRAGKDGRPGWSRGFRLTDQYRNGGFESTCLTHTELVRKVVRRRADQRDGIIFPVHRHLRDWHERLKVVTTFPETAFPLVCLADGEFRFTVCDQGRVHHNLSNLSREYRTHLRIGGRPLTGVDVVNSQPLILGLTLKASASAVKENIQAYAMRIIMAKRREYRQRNGEKTKEVSREPYLGTFSPACQNDELNRYIDLCLAGKLYEAVLDSLLDAEPGCGYDREKVKRKLFAVLYGHPRDGATRVGRAFRRLFPSLWEAVAAVNRMGKGALARRMQTVESYLVVHRTCGRLMRDLPEVPLLTVHDSLVSHDEHLGDIESVLREEFQAAFGVTPPVKRKSFAEEASPGVPTATGPDAGEVWDETFAGPRLAW